MKSSILIGSLGLASLGLCHPLADDMNGIHLQDRDAVVSSTSDSVSSAPSTSSIVASGSLSGTNLITTTATASTIATTSIPTTAVSTTSVTTTYTRTSSFLSNPTTVSSSNIIMTPLSANSAAATTSPLIESPKSVTSAISAATSQGRVTSATVIVTTSSAKLTTSITTTSTTASAIPTALLCPVVNGTTVTNQGSDWVIRCNSDSTPGAFRSQGVLHSYLECMGACDAQNGCTAFVYQGGANGTGSGQCWLQTYHGTYKAAPAGWIAAYKAVNGTAIGIAPVTSTVTPTHSITPSPSVTSAPSVSSTPVKSTTSASSTPSPQGILSCPTANSQNYTTNTGAVFVIECGLDHFSGNMMRFNTDNFQQCVETCASTKGCVDVTLNVGWCYLKSSIGAVSNSPSVWGARLVSNGTAAH